MSSQCWFSLLLVLSNILVDCTSAAVHGHSVDTADQERESDGSYRPRDAEHYGDAGHNVEFDHEAILGSVREAEEFDQLSPEEAKQRLADMLPAMDLNGDKFIDHAELKKWILSSFTKLSKEEASERLQEVDENNDGKVTWLEYLHDTFGIDSEDDFSNEDDIQASQLAREEKLMWTAADTDGDGFLDAAEFEVFTNPEEHAVMHPYLVNQTLREKDSNNDGKIDFSEYVGEKGKENNRDWLVAERDRFDLDLDTNRDGHLDRAEIQRWIIPDNDEIADEEVEHLFASADDDHDELLSFREVVDHHDVFVGSEAGHDVLGEHFDDEL